jgi:hypothetical protein
MDAVEPRLREAGPGRGQIYSLRGPPLRASKCMHASIPGWEYPTCIALIEPRFRPPLTNSSFILSYWDDKAWHSYVSATCCMGRS